MSQIIRIGSRESLLAVKQAEIVMEGIRRDNPEAQFELVGMRTSGDRNLDTNLRAIGGKGLFTKELEQALHDGVIDIAVHSYKDLPYQEDPELPIVALSERESPFDVLVLPAGEHEIDPALPVGTSSQRRAVQFTRLFPGIEVKPVRGNVVTRLAKLDVGEYSALLLAQAGLQRLGFLRRMSRVFTADEMIPAASQGIIAVQARAGENCSYLSGFHSWESEVVSLAERQYLRSLGSDCDSPVAAFGELEDGILRLRGMFVGADGEPVFGQVEGDASQAKQLGEQLAMQLSGGRP